MDIPVAAQSFHENIRLVIWDLDETFWRGTVTEGGHHYVQAHHDLVITLARRGIISTICSANDFNTIQKLLEATGLWDYFVFPSIDWSAKAPRIKALIEQIGLRAPTVLFIDDNLQNLNQTLDLIPDINVALPAIIPALAGHAQMQGKDDAGLSRLHQYKLLEKRDVESRVAGQDTIAFLRKSDICVYFDYDVERHIDRAIELINRTNQLNFTKERLPEKLDEARAALIPFVRSPGTACGLIRVSDKYGDYGYVGFYAMTNLNREWYLKHFCFSCRTLNMSVEHAVYHALGRPHLQVQGEVLSDVQSADQAPDWVRILPIEKLSAAISDTSVKRIDSIYVRGGCDLTVLMHYLGMNCSSITAELIGIKNWQSLRWDHSAFLALSLRGITDEQLRAAEGLGYDSADFKTVFPLGDDAPEVYLLSFWADADIPLYRHKATGLELPYFIGGGKEDLIANVAFTDMVDLHDLQRERIDVLRAEWAYIGGMTQADMRTRYREILQAIPASSKVVMTLANERPPQYFTDPSRPLHQDHVEYNEVLRELAGEFRNVILIDVSSVIQGADDLVDINHLRRDNYFKLYQMMMAQL